MLKNIQEIILKYPGQFQLISLGDLHLSEGKWRISGSGGWGGESPLAGGNSEGRGNCGCIMHERRT